MLVSDNDEDSFCVLLEDLWSIHMHPSCLLQSHHNNNSEGREVVQGHPGELKEKERESS